MNEQSLKAYLNLIQGLLSCPRGEEWILLRQNEELVNRELVEVMEQVASHLAREGQIQGAKYLHNWAGKLHHILAETVPTPKNNNAQTQAYLELLQALLNCPKGSVTEILAAHQELIDPQLVKVMKQVASESAAKGDEETASFLTNLATDLSRTWLKNHEFKPTLKKEVVRDPWGESDSPAQELYSTETPSTDLEVPAIEEPVSSSPQPKIETDSGQLPLQLQMIADSLLKLEATLASRLPPLNPLWYMEILEKAEAAQWILTTDEVEHLIGIKPQCHHEETSYHIGLWIKNQC